MLASPILMPVSAHFGVWVLNIKPTGSDYFV